MIDSPLPAASIFPAKNKTLLGAVVLLVLIVGAYAYVLSTCLRETEGHFTYALDDPYIHLAIAKNLALHGIWGVTPYASSSASSSPLWTVLLAIAIRIGGNFDLWPLIFGLIASTAAALLIYFRFFRSGFGVAFAIAGAAAIFLVGPLHLLPFAGMEHSLQILLDLLFIFWLIDAMGRPTEGRDLIAAVVLTGLTCACRYESAFLVFVPFFACLLNRNWRLAVALAAGPILAIGGFALYSHFVGMPPVPNSILLKGNTPRSSFGMYAHYLVLRTWHELYGRSPVSDLFILNLLAGIALSLPNLKAKSGPLRIAVWTVAAACVFHAAFAMIGIFYRYEAYLVVLSLTVILMTIRQIASIPCIWADVPVTDRNWLLATGLFCVAQFAVLRLFWFVRWNFSLVIFINVLAVTALIARGKGPQTKGRLIRILGFSFVFLALFFTSFARVELSFIEASAGSRDIYLQQVQMGRFVNRYYPTGRLAANDIGAVSYFSDVHLLDLVGLATDSIRRLRMAHLRNTATLGAEIDAFRPDVIIVYEDWFQGPEALPSSLIPVARWEIPPVTTSSRSIVTFFATNQAAADRLAHELFEFQRSLPTRVKPQQLLGFVNR